MKRIEFYKWALDGLKTTHYFYEWVDLKEHWAEADPAFQGLD